jgi:hypothetical protein
MIEYLESCKGIRAEQLTGFFDGWVNPPKPAVHLRLLHGSDHVILAVDGKSRRVVGFITAITDGVLTAYIPYLEVLPEWQNRGIGVELTRRMLARLKNLYAVDLLCDPALEPFYGQFRMIPAHGMILRRYERQTGAPPRAANAKPESKAALLGRLMGWMRRKKPEK